MGCGSSLEATMHARNGAAKKGKKGKKKGGKGGKGGRNNGNDLDDFNAIMTQGHRGSADGVVVNILAPPSQQLGGLQAATASKSVGAKQTVVAMGKEKFISSYGSLLQDVNDPAVGQGTLVVFVPISTSSQASDGLSFCFRKNDGSLFGLEYSNETALKHAKDSAGIKLGWSAVFKSLHTDISKGKGILQPDPRGKGLLYTFTVRGGLKGESDRSDNGEPFPLLLTRLNQTTENLRVWFLEPTIRRVQTNYRRTDQEDAFTAARLECGTIVTQGSIDAGSKKVERLEQQVAKYKKKSQQEQTKADATLQKIAQLESKRMKMLSKAKNKDNLAQSVEENASQTSGRHSDNAKKHVVDRVYEDGGALHFPHTEYSETHYPKTLSYDRTLSEWLKKKLHHRTSVEEEARQVKEAGGKEGKDYESQVPPPLSLQAVALSLYPNMDAEAINRIEGKSNTLWRVMENLERWEYNVFEVEELTNGNGLFFTCYALLHRLSLVTHFGIDDRTLRHFLLAVQSGYHHNQYHNSTHAADVCHILSYVVNWGGLQKVCPLVQEETLAAVLTGAIHDYDHPGCNNNFHTRTNAYLSTLYNDRSILENHHLACVFEMMRLPKYNILANMDDESRKEVRDTIIECVLSTDMGQHGKIMHNFQGKIQEGCNWSQKKDDVRLLLSMCTKMADTSNCGRPNHLYTAWAKNIAAEFYDQGDVEQRLNLDVSPFMNRSRHLDDFAKGQSSFISFVIEPMFNAMVEVLPDLEFVLQYSSANKAYWQTHTPDDLGAIEERGHGKKKVKQGGFKESAPSELSSRATSHSSMASGRQK